MPRRRRAHLLRPPARGPVAGTALVVAASLPIVFAAALVSTRVLAGTGSPRLDVAGAGHVARFAAETGLFRDPTPAVGEIVKRLGSTGFTEELRARRPLFGPAEIVAVEKSAVALLPASPPLAMAADGTLLGPASVEDAARSGVLDFPVVQCGEPLAPGFPACLELAGSLAATLLERPDLDRFVSELDGTGGGLRIVVTLRPWPVRVVLTSERFHDGLAAAVTHLPDLLSRWPDLAEVDARIDDRLLLRLLPEPPEPAFPTGGEIAS